MAASYGAIAVEVHRAPSQRRSPGLALVALAFCVVALVAATASWAQATVLEQFEIVPLGGSMGDGRVFMGLHLGDDAAKNLPEERVYETNGMVPPEEKRCPGSWCAQDPDRIYPDGRGEWPAGPKFELTWGACNIAIQDC